MKSNVLSVFLVLVKEVSSTSRLLFFIMSHPLCALFYSNTQETHIPFDYASKLLNNSFFPYSHYELSLSYVKFYKMYF